MFNYIAPIKRELEKGLHKIALNYTVNRDSIAKSPRWVNYKGFDDDTKVLSLQSTNYSSNEFEVQTDYPFVEIDEFWAQFKAFRTLFLETNYPNIRTF